MAPHRTQTGSPPLAWGGRVGIGGGHRPPRITPTGVGRTTPTPWNACAATDHPVGAENSATLCDLGVFV